jgi:gliding motility-associated-like protein
MNWKTATIFAIVLGWHGCALAQYNSALGRFQVDQVKACAPFLVTVTINPPFVCDGSNPCDMDFEGNNQPKSLTFTHTYAQPGKYNLKILFSTTGWDSISVDVVPNIPPQFDVYTCGNNEVSVQLNDTNYDEYVINYNDGSPEAVVNGSGMDYHTFVTSSPQNITVRGRDLNAEDNCNQGAKSVTPLLALPAPTITLLEVLDDKSIRLEYNTLPNIQYKLGIATNNNTTFQQVKTFSNQTVDTVFNLGTDDNYYCFRLAAFDPCNNIVVNSATICSPNLDLAVRNKAIDVSWATAAAGINTFRLVRDASDGTTLTTSPAGSPYADQGITCGIQYCYQLTMNYANGSRSISLLKCGVGFSTEIPTAIDNVSAVVGDNSVVLDWQTDPNFIPAAFSLDKSIGGKYSFLDTAVQKAYADSGYKVEDASCYRISYEDVCNNRSAVSLEACPIRLSGGLLKDNSINLSWTPYEGWTQGVSGYIVEKYSEDGQLLQTFQAGTGNTYVDTSDDLNFQTFVYVVKAVPVENGLTQSASNRVFVLKDPNLFHPTAFTPNGDNLNDIFTVFGQYVVGFEMKVFNRWGELMFTTTDIQTGWDGTFHGKQMPEGTYTFIAFITDRAGRTFKRSGSVLLLRKG